MRLLLRRARRVPRQIAIAAFLTVLAIAYSVSAIVNRSEPGRIVAQGDPDRTAARLHAEPGR
jgi:hypothetical protein